MTRVSKWYLKWLALQRKKSSLQPKQRPEVQNIQSDVPGCRDDLCIAEEVEPDYSDEKNPKESPKLNPRDVICPHGFVPIVRDRIIYCDITQLSTEKVTENVICAGKLLFHIKDDIRGFIQVFVQWAYYFRITSLFSV